jgi:DNA-binding LytR/AlgR family response regulator
MFLKIRAFLRQPFPFELPIIRILLLSSTVGLFVSIFLLIFKPFGVGAYVLEGRAWIIWGYGLVTFLVLVINRTVGPAVLPRLFNEAKWTVFKDLSFQFWHILSIGAANLLFAAVVGAERIRFLAVPVFLLQALAVGFFPLSLGAFSTQTVLFKRYAESTRQMNESLRALGSRKNGSDVSPETVVLSAESGKEKVEVRLSDLLLIKSVDNYIEIYTADNDRVSAQILRSSLRRIAQDLKDLPFLFKCHRAFLVNVRNIHRVAGNSQGYKLIFKGIEFEVPVSRNTSKGLFRLVIRPRTGSAPQRPV